MNVVAGERFGAEGARRLRRQAPPPLSSSSRAFGNARAVRGPAPRANRGVGLSSFRGTRIELSASSPSFRHGGRADGAAVLVKVSHHSRRIRKRLACKTALKTSQIASFGSRIDARRQPKPTGPTSIVKETGGCARQVVAAKQSRRLFLRRGGRVVSSHVPALGRGRGRLSAIDQVRRSLAATRGHSRA